MDSIDYNKIVLFCPTYGRSHNHLPSFISSAITCSSPESTCFAFLLNVKDEASRRFIEEYDFGAYRHEVIFEDLPQPHLAKYYNQLYNETRTQSEPGTVVSILGDDMIFRTVGWDQRMLDLINAYNGVGVFYANDDFIAHEKMCVNAFVTRDFVAATEEPFACELFQAEFIDTVWHLVGKYTRTLHYDPDSHIFHNHGSARPDETYNRLQPFRNEAWKDGKRKSQEAARRIADRLIAKGLTGDSIC